MQKAIKPSAIFPNASARIFRQFETDAVVEKAHQTFKEKTYLERYKGLYSAANVASFLLQALSAIFAFTFGQHLAASVLSQFSETFVKFTSYFLAALMLIGLEVFKRLCLGSFVVTYIQSRASQSGVSVSWAALAVNLCLISVAVYTSTEGAKEFTRRKTDKSEAIRGKYAEETQSTATAIQAQINAEKKSLADFMQSVSWQGKINMGETNTAFTIASHNRRLEELQGEKEKALATIRTQLQSDLNGNAAKTAKDSGNMFWVSLVVELAGLLCIGYVFFYLSRVFIENSVSGGDGNKSNVSQEEGGFSNRTTSIPVTANHAASPKDFQQYDQRPSETDGEIPNPSNEKYPFLENQPSPSGFSAADLQGFLRKYENVVKCLEEGLSNKQVSKRCKVSETTVHNVKRCLRNLGNGTIDLG